MILGEEPHQGIQDPVGTDVPEDLVLGGLDAETGYAEEAYGLEVALHHPDEFLAVVLRALTAVLDEPGADLPPRSSLVKTTATGAAMGLSTSMPAFLRMKLAMEATMSAPLWSWRGPSGSVSWLEPRIASGVRPWRRLAMDRGSISRMNCLEP